MSTYLFVVLAAFGLWCVVLLFCAAVLKVSALLPPAQDEEIK